VSAIAKAAGHEDLFGLTFQYGQTLVREIDGAKQTANRFGFKEHKVLHIPINEIGAGALIDGSAIPKDRGLHEMQVEIPATYVTYRNGIFLSLAVAFAEARGASHIYGGWNVVDYSGYPDCRKEFLEAVERAANIGTKAGAQDGVKFQIHAPLLFLNKAAIIKRGLELGVDYAETWSCYEGGAVACGECDSCKLRVNGFRECGIKDPIAYAIPQESIR
jgi:7-cyano-7-deazaguanine synthase